MDPLLRNRVARLAHREPVGWVRVQRGYTPAERWVVTFADGSSAFAKIGTTPATADWVRAEHQWYSLLREDFLPKVVGLDDDPDRPVLLLEDLSAARWPPPWGPGELERVLSTLRRIAATRPLPANLRSLEEDRPSLAGWTLVQLDAAPFLALGLCSPDWLARALPVLLEAQDAAVLRGDDLLHNDVRSDNLCLLPERVVLVDWNKPRCGNAAYDRTFLAPSARLEGGPLPEEIAPDAGPLTAVISGYFAANAGLPVIPDAPAVRKIQQRQLRIALPWAARVLGLHLPICPGPRLLSTASKPPMKPDRSTRVNGTKGSKRSSRTRTWLRTILARSPARAVMKWSGDGRASSFSMRCPGAARCSMSDAPTAT